MTPTRGPEVAESAGLSYRQLDYWTRQGWLIPQRAAPGSGNVRSYGDDEVTIASLMAALVDLGSPARVAELARAAVEGGQRAVRANGLTIALGASAGAWVLAAEIERRGGWPCRP